MRKQAGVLPIGKLFIKIKLKIMARKCDFCEKDFTSKRQGWRCPDCGATLCDKCCEKEFTDSSWAKAPLTVLSFGKVNTLKRVCLKCGSKRLRRI